MNFLLFDSLKFMLNNRARAKAFEMANLGLEYEKYFLLHSFLHAAARSRTNTLPYTHKYLWLREKTFSFIDQLNLYLWNGFRSCIWGGCDSLCRSTTTTAIHICARTACNGGGRFFDDHEKTLLSWHTHAGENDDPARLPTNKKKSNTFVIPTTTHTLLCS